MASLFPLIVTKNASYFPLVKDPFITLYLLPVLFLPNLCTWNQVSFRSYRRSSIEIVLLNVRFNLHGIICILPVIVFRTLTDEIIRCFEPFWLLNTILLLDVIVFVDVIVLSLMSLFKVV